MSICGCRLRFVFGLSNIYFEFWLRYVKMVVGFLGGCLIPWRLPDSLMVAGFLGGINFTDVSAENRVGLVNTLKSKLQNPACQHSDVLESLTPIVRKRVEVLRGIQSERDEIEAKFFEERAALELKYQKLYEPLYLKKYDIVNGVVEVDELKDETATDQTDVDFKKRKKVCLTFG